MRREAAEANTQTRQTAGHRDAVSMARFLSRGGATMRDVVVAGGLRGFTPADLFPERAA